MLSNKKTWGTKTAWAMTFFDLIAPPPPPSANAAADSASSSPPTAASSPSPVVARNVKERAKKQVEKQRKRQEIDPQTRWRCRRCHAVLHPPLDPATQKPRYSVMMAEHLEGVSSGGTTHLATGVCVCTAGTLRYTQADLADTEANGSPSSPSSSPRQGGHAVDGGGATDTPTGSGGGTGGDGSAAYAAVVDLLRSCQQAALADSRAAASGQQRRDGDGDASTHHQQQQQPPPSLVFIVVENPKTPANAGGVLRAMKCYGIHGPSTPRPPAPPSLPVTTDSVRGAMADGGGDDDDSEDASTQIEGAVTPRVGAFLFSGTRLQKALAHTGFTNKLRTDPTHASREIPQLCLPTLNELFAVLKNEYGHAPHTRRQSAVRVVAVELVEGAMLLPAFAHPFCQNSRDERESASLTGQPHSPPPTTPSADGVSWCSEGGVVPMTFYVFGAEDGTLDAQHVAQDVDEVVFMPTTGSMNLAATVNVLLYDRIAKECCGMRPAVGEDGSGEERTAGKKWQRVFESRNANNRTRWTRPQ